MICYRLRIIYVRKSIYAAIESRPRHSDDVCLQDCYEYLFVDYNVTEVLVRHSGSDAWQCENIKLYFDDGVYVQCDYGDFLDNESVPLTCERAN